MRYALFSDIHGNLEAFQAVLNDLKSEDVDQYVFLGDVVGYGADPGSCVALVQELVERQGCLCVVGNHDCAACGRTDYSDFSGYAKDSILWTIDQLTERDKSFLKRLPLTYHVKNPEDAAGDFAMVHASMNEPESWHYILDIDDAYPNFPLFNEQICFIGHSHRPMVFTAGETFDWFLSDKVKIEEGIRYIINVGSVGQPRDGNPRAAYAIFDSKTREVFIRRVRYDVAAAQSKIIKVGLPRLLADRLQAGR